MISFILESWHKTEAIFTPSIVPKTCIITKHNKDSIATRGMIYKHYLIMDNPFISMYYVASERRSYKTITHWLYHFALDNLCKTYVKTKINEYIHKYIRR